MNQNSYLMKLKNASVAIGNIILIAAGLVFVYLLDTTGKLKGGTSQTDVYLSVFLSLGIVFSIGAAIFYFSGESMKHKPVLSLVLKGVGLLISFGFIIYSILFRNFYILGTSKSVSVPFSTDATPLLNSILIICIIVGSLGIAIMALNYVLSILLIKEDY